MHLFVLYSSCKLIVLAFVLEKRSRKQSAGKREAAPSFILEVREGNP